MENKRFLVIGAGSAGISGISQLKDRGFNDICCFEARREAGGTWTYQKDPPELEIRFTQDGRPVAVGAEEEIPSAIYKHLHTNLPHPLMSYRKRPFEPGTALYPSHEVVTKYLQDAASEHADKIVYNRRITRLCYPPPGSRRKRRWLVESIDTRTGTTHEDDFDFVLSSNGHFSTPYIPYIEGLWDFRGRIQHSRNYRRPSTYAKETVMVVGGNASGYDITRDLACHLYKHETDRHPKIYQSVRSPDAMFSRVEGPEASILSVVSEISHIEGKNIVLKDGSSISDVTLILFATGYLYSYPFCSEEDEPFKSRPLTSTPLMPANIDTPCLPDPVSYPSGGLVTQNLDKLHLFYYPDPTLAVPGLHIKVVPFPLVEAQSRAVAARWSGLKFPLERPEDSDKVKASIYLGADQWDYEDHLMRLIGEGGGEDEVYLNEKGEKTYGDVVLWRRGLRMAGNTLKKASLGY